MPKPWRPFVIGAPVAALWAYNGVPFPFMMTMCIVFGGCVGVLLAIYDIWRGDY